MTTATITPAHYATGTVVYVVAIDGQWGTQRHHLDEASADLDANKRLANAPCNVTITTFTADDSGVLANIISRCKKSSW